MTRPVGSIFFSEKNGRNYIVTQDESGREKLTALARFNWENAYGPIPDGLEVDHIDGDKTNDSVSNLQLLRKEDNIAKSRKRTYVDLVCKGCGDVFSIWIKDYNRKLRDGTKNFYCSKGCYATSRSTEGDEYKCHHCQTVFMRKKKEMNRHKCVNNYNVYCSAECKHASMKYIGSTRRR